MRAGAAWLCFVTCCKLLKEFQYLNLKEHTLIEVMLWSCSWMESSFVVHVPSLGGRTARLSLTQTSVLAHV